KNGCCILTHFFCSRPFCFNHFMFYFTKKVAYFAHSSCLTPFGPLTIILFLYARCVFHSVYITFLLLNVQFVFLFPYPANNFEIHKLYRLMHSYFVSFMVLISI